MTNSAKMEEPAPAPDDRAKVAVEKWLNSQGYPLEYKTYGALWGRFAGHAGLGMYVQGESGEPREIDVHAQWSQPDLDKKVTFLLRLICECRYSKAKPWVLLYGNPDPSFWVTDWWHTPRSTLLTHFPDLLQDQVKELCQAFHFTEGAPLAHSIVQAYVQPQPGDEGDAAVEGRGHEARRDERDRAYDALRKISHAAWDSIAAFERRMPKTKWYAMIFPCLVVEAPLFAASFNFKTGRVCARPIPCGRVCWQGCRDGTNVDVVQADALDDYAKRVDESFLVIMRLLRTLYDG